MKNGQNIKPARMKKRSTWWRYLLAFTGGFGFCIASFAIGIAFAGRAVRMKDIVTLVGGNPDEFIGTKYQNETIEGMIRSLIGGKFETLGDINEVTPLIKKTIEETVNPMLDQELHYQFNWEELKTKPFVLNASSERPETEYDHTISIGEYIPKDMKEHIYLASFMVSGSTDPSTLSGIMKLFLYPYEVVSGSKVFDYDSPYSIADIMQDGFFENKINEITIGDVLPSGSSNPFLDQMKDWTIGDFSDEQLRTLKIGLLFSESMRNDNPLLNTIYENDWTINDLTTENINGLKISEILDTSSATGLLDAIKNNTIEEITTDGFVNNLLLEDIFTNPTGILEVMVNEHFTVGDLNDETKIMSLTVDQIFSPSSGDLLYTFKDYQLSELSGLDISEVKLVDVVDVNSNPIFKALYDNDNDVTIGDLSDPDVINEIPLESVVEPGTNKVLLSLVDKGTTVGSIATDINSLTLKEVIDIDTSDPSTPPFLIALKDTNINNLGSALESLTVGDVMNLDPSDPLYAVKDIEISDSDGLYNGIKDSLLNTLTLRDVIDDIDSAPAVLKALADENIGDLPDKLKTLTLNEILGTSSSSSPILTLLGGVTVFGDGDNNLEFALEHINLFDVLGDDAYVDVSDNTKARNAVKVNIKLVDDDFEGGNIKTGSGTIKESLDVIDNNFETVKHLDNVKFVYDKEVKRAFVDYLFSPTVAYNDSYVTPSIIEMYQFITGNTMSSEQIAEIVDGTYTFEFSGHECTLKAYKACEIGSSFWFIFSEEGEDFDIGYERYILRKGLTYTINNMTKLTTNMTYHMQNETLFNLCDAGFLTADSTFLNKTLKTTIAGHAVIHGGSKIGDLTVNQLMEVLESISTYITD